MKTHIIIFIIIIIISFRQGIYTYIPETSHVPIKGKSVPLQTWSGPEASRKLKFPNFMTTAQKGGKVVSLKHRPHLPPGNPPGPHFC